MENVNVATVVQGNRFYTDQMSSCFDEFLRIKPDFSVLGEVFYMLLRDATTSLVKSIAKSCDNIVLNDNSEKIVDLAEKYARLYFSLNRDETTLLMLRSALYDLIREYDYNNKKYDTLSLKMYENIKKLITV